MKPVADETVDGTLPELLEGLPETLDALEAHPARHRPEVVRKVLETADRLRREGSTGCLGTAETGRRLAAEMPAFYTRSERCRLQALGLDVWGNTQRDACCFPAAETAYAAALEPLPDDDDPDREQLVGLLAQRVHLAGRRGDSEGSDSGGLARAVEQAVQATRFVESGDPVGGRPRTAHGGRRRDCAAGTSRGRPNAGRTAGWRCASRRPGSCPNRPGCGSAPSTGAWRRSRPSRCPSSPTPAGP